MHYTDEAIRSLQAFLADPAFPCVGAKSALATDGIRVVVAGDLRGGDADRSLLGALRATRIDGRDGFVATVALYPETEVLLEPAFERHVWERLQALHDIDSEECGWDPELSGDPASPDFGFSIGGAGFFVVGLHPGASRLARRAPVAMLAFNPHAQFRRLKTSGRYARMREEVRARDVALQGEVNPMLADHGTRSEAAQYSGRAVAGDWVCPFAARARSPHGA